MAKSDKIELVITEADILEIADEDYEELPLKQRRIFASLVIEAAHNLDLNALARFLVEETGVNIDDADPAEYV